MRCSKPMTGTISEAAFDHSLRSDPNPSPRDLRDGAVCLCGKPYHLCSLFGRRDRDRAMRAALNAITSYLDTCLKTMGQTGTQTH